MTENKEVIQIQETLDILVETTDHLSVLVKKEDLQQSVYIFTSIVKGSQAIANIFHEKDRSFNKEIEMLEKYLVNITNEFETRNFKEIIGIIHVSLRPLFVRLNQLFKGKLSAL